MKFIFRVLGAWFLALALVLLVKDIIISFASFSLIFSSLSQTWVELHASSWQSINDYLLSLPPFLAHKDIFYYITNMPAWIILTIIGILLLFAGKQRAKNKIVHIN